MKAEGLKYFTDAPILMVALVLFITCFIGFVFWVNRRGSGALYHQISHMPLTEPAASPKEDRNG